jgi:hypothetical protein
MTIIENETKTKKKKWSTRKRLMVVFLIFAVVFLITNILLWRHFSRCNFDCRIYAGDSYKIGNSIYKVPELPLHGDAYVLKESFLLDQRELLISVTNMFTHGNIKHWMSGGTLLGFTRHKTFMPWDDDIDMHTPWSNREYLHSSKFATFADTHDLEVIFLFGGSLKYATRESAGVRIRKRNTSVPVCDVFFVQEMRDSPNTFAKVDAWNKNQVTYNSKEQWGKELLFPLKKLEVDGMTLTVPQQPIPVLEQQYGKTAMTEMYARSIWFSHAYMFTFLGWVWNKKKINKKKINKKR